MSSDLSQRTIEGRVSGRFGAPLRYLAEAPSTNSIALEWAEAGAPEGALVVTNHQTSGRGRWGRSWTSAPGKLLQMSLVLRPKLSVNDIGLLTSAVGIACAGAIETVTSLPASIKWPNDVSIDGLKCAGILLESRVSGNSFETVVVGIGINVSWSQAEIPAEIADRATSLRARLIVAGRDDDVDRAELLAEVLRSIESRYERLVGGGAKTIVEEATLRSSVLGRRVRVRYIDGSTAEGRAVALSERGSLVLATGDERVEVDVAEVERLLDQ